MRGSFRWTTNCTTSARDMVCRERTATMSLQPSRHWSNWATGIRNCTGWLSCSGGRDSRADPPRMLARWRRRGMDYRPPLPGTDTGSHKVLLTFFQQTRGRVFDCGLQTFEKNRLVQSRGDRIQHLDPDGAGPASHGSARPEQSGIERNRQGSDPCVPVEMSHPLLVAW